MAFTRELPDDVRLDLARQIGERLTNFPTSAPELAPPGEPLLGESLPVMLLPATALANAGARLNEVVVKTQLWHHQVRRGADAPQFARSSGSDESQRIGEVVTSPLPSAIDNTIRFIDERIEDEDLEASLLTVPSYYLTAIMLVGDRAEKVVVAERPERLATIETGVIYGAEEFLKLLSSYDPNSGVPTDAL